MMVRGWLNAGVIALTPTLGLTASLETQQRILDLAEDWRTGSSAVSRGPDGEVVVRFGESQPTLGCQKDVVCVIKLQAGEVLTDAPAVADSVTWKITYRQLGEGATATPLLMVRPTEFSERTVLAIATNRRLYSIQLKNQTKGYTPILSFSYPEDDLRDIAKVIAAGKARVELEEAQGIPTSAGVARLDDLDFNYRLTGSAAFKPVRIWNDGVQTFIDLDRNYRGEQPVLLVETTSGDAVVNVRTKGERYIVDAVFDRARLMLGAGDEVVRLERVQ